MFGRATITLGIAHLLVLFSFAMNVKEQRTRMWANAPRDGHPAKYRWRPLFSAAVYLTPNTRVPCSKAGKTRNPLKFAGVPQTTGNEYDSHWLYHVFQQLYNSFNKNSSGDEIANVNFFYNIAHVEASAYAH